MNTVSPGASVSFIGVAQDGSGKKLANIAITTLVDAQDGNGPTIQTLLFQSVVVTQIDEYGAVLSADDRVDYEWKRQLLDEMRAIRLGMEVLMETGRPSFDPVNNSLIDEARRSRIDNTGGEPLEQET